MLRRPNRGWVWLLLPLSAAAVYLGANLFFYRGSYSPPSNPRVTQEQIRLPAPSYGPSADTAVPVSRKGVLVLDNAHQNDFGEEEISALVSKVASRGYSVEFLMSRDVVFSSGRLVLLEDQLRKADSFVVAVPRTAYTPDEIDTLRRFVGKGGKLLLVGDPTRSSEINTVADAFGIIFQDGYLYNVVEHDLNFRNIFVRDFHADEVTEGLNTIVLYTAGSVRSTGAPLAFTDINTFSSLEQRVEPFTPVVRGTDALVLAISDLTFMRSSHSSAGDNDRFISNIADFLTASERSFDLADFPYFFDDGIDILLGRGELFDIGARLKSLLSISRVASELRGVEDMANDTVFLGLYQDRLAVSQYLDAAGVQVDDESLRTPFTAEIDTQGTALLLVHEGHARRVLVLLGDTPRALESLLDRLRLGLFREGLVSDSLGVYRAP